MAPPQASGMGGGDEIEMTTMQRRGKPPAPKQNYDDTNSFRTQKRVDNTEVSSGCGGGSSFGIGRQDDGGGPTTKGGAHGRGGKKKQLPWCIRWTRHWSFKILPWSLVSSTPIAGILALDSMMRKMGFEVGGLAYYGNFVVTLWLCGLIIYNFVMASILEPGYVADQYIPPPNPRRGKYKLAVADEDSKGAGKNADTNKGTSKTKSDEIRMDAELEAKNPVAQRKEKAQKDERPLDLWYAPRFCEKCQVWKPPRSHHDSITGKCVLRMDHYCPFTGNVIAVNNHGHFVLMYCFAMVALLWGALHAVVVIQLALRQNAESFQRILMEVSQKWATSPNSFSMLTALNPMFLATELYAIAMAMVQFVGLDVIIFCVLEVIFFLIVTSCGGPAVYFATVNVTALEYNLPQLNEYVEISDQVFCPIGPHFYDMRSSWTNFKQVLGRNWLQRLFLPVRGDVDWKMLAYDPPCSPDAAEQIRMRILQWQEEGSRLQTKSYEELGITAPQAEGPPEEDTESSTTAGSAERTV
eukprot:CAMPEP_0178999222 /NCGR_PEP_ID=MMETSP0795-20121207/9932_1 /TAXON_ID=88552 /ORGANISM="Amoebophrya sp., Strain Ameob2" /LENGTH=523 /DNA_ID=CAMNT_0020691955 /DNA_START=265 /DNA_END=1836 /DNA_ORIENTATION=+